MVNKIFTLYSKFSSRYNRFKYFDRFYRIFFRKTLFRSHILSPKIVAANNPFVYIHILKCFYFKIYALKKFTGDLGDDDDRVYIDNQAWKKYFMQPLHKSETIIATRKVYYFMNSEEFQAMKLIKVKSL